MLTLYTYYRSSAAFRVRIALNLKKLSYTAIPVHLIRDGGAHHDPDYQAINPQKLLPTLVHDALTVTQSLAILEYLDECFPAPPLLPGDAAGRARVRTVALVIACDIHPLNNLRVLNYLQGACAIDVARRNEWYQHWIREGFKALEEMLGRRAGAGAFCCADVPTLADCCLVPQVYNALRYRCSLAEYPRVMEIYARCMQLDAFIRAAPDSQADAG